MAPRPPAEDVRDAPLRSWSRWSGLAGGFTRLPHGLRVALCLGLATGLYALLGFKLAPTVLRKQAIAYVREHYARTLQIGAVRVHPFALRIEVDDFALPDADGLPMVSWEHLSVNFEAAASLWQRAYVLHEIVLREPRLRAISRADGNLNLADLASVHARVNEMRALAGGKPAPRRPTAEPPALEIAELRVTGGNVEYIDRARSPEFSQRFSPVSFRLRDFHTTAAGGAFALSAQSAPSARFWWKGDIALSPMLGSSGSFAVANLSAATVAEFLDQSLPFEVSDGLVSANGTYRASLDSAAETELRLHKLELSGIALHARGAPQDSVAIPALVVDNSVVRLRARQVEVGNLHATGLSTRVVREQNGGLNLSRLFAQRTPQAHADGAAWTFRLHQLALSEAELELVDRAVDPPVELIMAPLELELSELTLDPLADIPFSLNTNIDQHCGLRLTGSATPGSGALALAVELSHARIGTLQPYVSRYADLTVRDGLLDVRGTLAVAPTADAPAALSFEGDVIVSELKTTDTLLDEALLEIARLELSALSYRSAPESLRIARVSLHKPYARLVLSREQTLNMAVVLQRVERVERASVPAPAARFGIRSRADQSSLARGGTAHFDAPISGSLRAPPPPAELPRAPMAVAVGAIAVDDLRLSFTDHFIQPNFSTELHGLSGTIEALSSDPASHARVALSGRLGASAPVSISGSLRPFAYDAATDLWLRWKNVPLAVFNPYSGRFAGYSIERGDLASALHYKLKNGKLDAQHHIRVDQLTWGDASDTKESAGLPVRLATAMLRDRDGVIALDIPVQGKLSDPTFRVGPLVWQAIENVALRAATAPFEWLGSLFEGAERARYVDFVPGDAVLSVDDASELRSLARALVERPKLQVDVPLGVDRELDRLAIVERKYQSALKTTIGTELWGKQKQHAFAALDRGDKLDVLEALYEQLTGKEPAVSEPPEPPPDSSWSARRALRKDFRISALERLTRAAIKVEPAELEELGLRRADVIEQTLVADGQVDTTRVLVSSTGVAARGSSADEQGRVHGQDGKVRFELALE